MPKISTSVNKLATYKQIQLQRHYEDNMFGSDKCVHFICEERRHD